MVQLMRLQFRLSISTLPSQSLARCCIWSLSSSVHEDHSQSSAGETYWTKYSVSQWVDPQNSQFKYEKMRHLTYYRLCMFPVVLIEPNTSYNTWKLNFNSFSEIRWKLPFWLKSSSFSLSWKGCPVWKYNVVCVDMIGPGVVSPKNEFEQNYILCLLRSIN